jgi:antitoxin component YwqK of YwqJK toxin-antitoxin module
MSADDNLVALIEHIQKQYPEGQLLYKSCTTADDSWIVLLRPVEDSITNQSRLPAGDPDRKYAKFRGSEFEVIDIINKFDLTKTINSIQNSTYENKTEYIKGTIVRPDSFDPDLDKVCSNGIHFFEDIMCAFYYELDSLPDYTGHWAHWNDNGQREHDCHYSNGALHGLWIHWHDNGEKFKEGHFSEGYATGRWITRYRNGLKMEEGDYLNGQKVGQWSYW